MTSLQNLDSITRHIRAGESSLGRLLNDMAASLDRLTTRLGEG